MNARENSDESVVPATSANNDGAEPLAESIEERGSAKRNDVPTDLPRTPGRIKCKSSGLHGVREAARKDSTLKFTALLHHVNVDCLTEAFFNLKKTAAVGIDEVTWQEYERNVEANIVDLHERIHRGAYRAKQDFVGFSNGFRPGRGGHDALDALYVAITSKKVNQRFHARLKAGAV